jgi:hypothetical protein
VSNEILGIRKPGKPAEATPPEQIESQQESSLKLNRPARIEQKEETASQGEQTSYKPIRPKRFESKRETTGNYEKKQFSKPSFPKKPSRYDKFKKTQVLVERIPEATNANGELFKPGDKIRVLAPWCMEVEGEITGFYKGGKGSIFAEFVPQKTGHEWNWEKGCIRAELLKLA